MISLEKKQPDFIAGAYGCVFFTQDARATKVFFRRPDATEAHIEQIFKSEVHAYEIASSRPELRTLIPTYFGCVSVKKITDAMGEDISHHFYLDRAYQMQRIVDTFIKLNEFTPDIKHQVERKFFLAGIHHICDASAVVKENKVECIIDFAMQDYPLEHESIAELDFQI